MTTPLDSTTPISYNRGYFGNRSTHSVLFCTFIQKSVIFLFRYAWANFLKSGSRLTLSKWIPSTRFFDHPLPRYDTCTCNALRYIVTLTTDLLTLNGCRKFFVKRSNPPPTLSICILRPSVLESWCSHSDCFWPEHWSGAPVLPLSIKAHFCDLRLPLRSFFRLQLTAPLTWLFGPLRSGSAPLTQTHSINAKVSIISLLFCRPIVIVNVLQLHGSVRWLIRFRWVSYYITLLQISCSIRMLTRKPCCRKETARCHSCSFRFKVRRQHSLHVLPGCESQASDLQRYTQSRI